MDSKTGRHEAKPGCEKPSKPVWVATFTLLDASGAITSSQLQWLMAPMKKHYQKAFC